MTHDEFTTIDAELMATCNAVLEQRGRAYASDQDRFANFREVAEQTGLTPLAVCHIYMLKGFSVINKLMRGETVEGETVQERFADAINYLRIAYAMRAETATILLTEEEAQRLVTETHAG